MKPEIKKLNQLIKLALLQDIIVPGLETEILNLLHTLETSLRLLPFCNIKPVLAGKNLQEASAALSNLMYNLSIGLLNKSYTASGALTLRANQLYKEINTGLEFYRPNLIQAPADLLPLNMFLEMLAQVNGILKDRFYADDLYTILLPHLFNQAKNKGIERRSKGMVGRSSPLLSSIQKTPVLLPWKTY